MSLDGYTIVEADESTGIAVMQKTDEVHTEDFEPFTSTEQEFITACRQAHAQASGQDMSMTLLYRDQQRAARNVTYREY